MKYTSVPLENKPHAIFKKYAQTQGRSIPRQIEHMIHERLIRLGLLKKEEV